MLDARGRRDVATARVLVNATGPWVGRFARDGAAASRSAAQLRLDQGQPHRGAPPVRSRSRLHLPDRRRARGVRAAVRSSDFTLIGTTDQEFAGDPGGVAPSADEIDYLCAAVNDYFRAADRARRCGLVVRRRALALRRRLDEAAGHDARLRAGARRAHGEAPLLTVYGGKITTYRRLAEEALDRLAHVFKARPGLDRGLAPAGRRFRLATASTRWSPRRAQPGRS